MKRWTGWHQKRLPGILAGWILLGIMLSGLAMAQKTAGQRGQDPALLTPPLPPAIETTLPVRAVSTPGEKRVMRPQPTVSPGGRAMSVPPSMPATPAPVAAQAPIVPTEPVATQAAPLPANASDTAPAPTTAQPASGDEPLDQVFSQRRRSEERFTSTGYLFQVFGILAVLLLGFYGVARFLLPRYAQHNQPLIPFGKSVNPAASPAGNSEKRPSVWQMLFPQAVFFQDASMRAKVLSRTRLGPTKEILIVQVGDRQLVIGSTAQQMTLLTEMPTAQTPPPQPDASPDVYKKYLGKTQPPPSSPQPAIPEEEEVFLLEDYEDQYEHPG